MRTILILLVTAFVVVTRAADPTIAGYSVNDLLAQPGWVDVSPPAIANGNCVPSHRVCKRWMDPHEIEPSTSTASYNFGMFENGQLRYMVHLKNILGIKRIHARTGPRSQHHKRKQHSMWACPFVPELELELQPRGENNELLEPVELDLIVFLTECDLDILGGEDPREHLAMGIEYGFLGEMKMTPLYSIESQYNTDLYGELAIAVHLDKVTPGHNRFMFARGNPEGMISAFNAEQGNGEHFINQNVAWQFPLLIIVAVLTTLALFFNAAGYFGTDRQRKNQAAAVQAEIASNTQLAELLLANTQALERIENHMQTSTGYMPPRKNLYVSHQ